MKKRILIPLIAIMMLVMSATAVHAVDVLYAEKGNTYVYAEKNTKSRILRTLHKGDKLLVEQLGSSWSSVLVEDPRGGQKLGWVRMDYMSLNHMPSNICSHKWTEWNVTRQATCTSGGMMERYCTICGIGEAKDIPKADHRYSGWQTVKKATCTETGLQTRYCTACGREESRTLDRVSHKYGEWRMLRYATCTREGERARYCAVCGKEERKSVKKKAHEYGEWRTMKDATCTSYGERMRVCKVCAYQERKKTDMRPHSYGKWTTTSEATCAAEGAKVRTCKNCGHRETEKIAKLPHTFETKVLKEATDHSAGIRVNVCRKCGYSEPEESFDPVGTLRRGDRGEAVRRMQQLLADQNYLNADGADGIFGGGTEIAVMSFQKDQNITPDGVGWPQTLKKLKHDFGAWQELKELTRETAGDRVRTCRDCGYKQHDELALSPVMESGRRGEDVRAVQQMLTSLGYEAGTFDGIYGKKLDVAYGKYAEAEKIRFTAGKLLPFQIDALVNSWIASVPEKEWKESEGTGSPVNLALTVTPVQEKSYGSIMTYSWSLTNLGDESCIFTTLLLNYGENPDFRSGNIVTVIDGEELLPACGNSVSGSFIVSKAWGTGNISFCALAVSESTGTKWLSNRQ